MRPILKNLCAALLRSFRGQHSEKMKGIARGNWDPREDQQPFRPNPNGFGDRTTTLRRLLIGAGVDWQLIAFVIVLKGCVQFVVCKKKYRSRLVSCLVGAK